MNPTPLLDLFDIESLWNEEQCMVRDNVRRFARNEFAPGVANGTSRDLWTNHSIS